MKKLLFLCVLVLSGSTAAMAQRAKTVNKKVVRTSKRVVKATSKKAVKPKVAVNKWTITDPVNPNELRTENVSRTKVVSVKTIKSNTYSKIDTVSVDTMFTKAESLPADTSYVKVDPNSADTTFTKVNDGIRTVTTVQTFTVKLQVDSRNNAARLISNRPLNKIIVKKASGEVVKEEDVKNETEYAVPFKGLAKGEYLLVCNAENGQIRTFVVKINK